MSLNKMCFHVRIVLMLSVEEDLKECLPLIAILPLTCRVVVSFSKYIVTVK